MLAYYFLKILLASQAKFNRKKFIEKQFSAMANMIYITLKDKVIYIAY